jgi:hypothetical protein
MHQCSPIANRGIPNTDDSNGFQKYPFRSKADAADNVFTVFKCLNLHLSDFVVLLYNWMLLVRSCFCLTLNMLMLSSFFRGGGNGGVQGLSASISPEFLMGTLAPLCGNILGL